MKAPHLGSLVLAVATFLSSASAGAVDLTGTWDGEQRCTFFDGVQTRLSFGLANRVKISQTDNRIAVETPGGVGSFYNGDVLTDSSKATKGRAVLAECQSSTDLSGYSELVHLEGSASSDSGTLRGESVFRSQLGEVGTCKWKLKRSSAENPGAIACPCCN